jgi:hypothetical protein
MDGVQSEMKGLSSKDPIVEPPLPLSILGSAVGAGFGIAIFATLLALVLEYIFLGEIGTNYQLTGWLGVWSGIAHGFGVIFGAKEAADSTDPEIEDWMNERKQHNSFLKSKEYRELKKSEKAKEREEFKKSDFWWLTRGMLWLFFGFFLLAYAIGSV